MLNRGKNSFYIIFVFSILLKWYTKCLRFLINLILNVMLIVNVSSGKNLKQRHIIYKTFSLIRTIGKKRMNINYNYCNILLKGDHKLLVFLYSKSILHIFADPSYSEGRSWYYFCHKKVYSILTNLHVDLKYIWYTFFLCTNLYTNHYNIKTIQQTQHRNLF